MTDLPAIALLIVDETTVAVTADLLLHRVEHQAMLDWCRLHGMDPKRMPAHQMIVRDLERCRVEYDEFVYAEDGTRVLEHGDLADPASWVGARRRVHAQGETPPMPFPDVILRHLDTTQEIA